MNEENSHWDSAEKDFSLMLAKEDVETGSPFSAVLSSAFLIFRNEQKRKLQAFCEKSFAYLEKLGLNEGNDFYRDSEVRFSKISPVIRDEDSLSDNVLMFSLLKEPASEYKSNLAKEDNERIINGILQGNQKIFNALYEYEFPKVVRYVKMNSGDVDQAKDIFQDAIVILVEKVRRMELDLTCSIKTYLFSISQHLWMEQLRVAKKNTPLNKTSYQIPVDISVISFDIRPDIYDEVNKAIDQLNNNGKTILECFYYKKMSCEEIAELLGYSSAASVRNQKYKYLEKIRKSVILE